MSKFALDIATALEPLGDGRFLCRGEGAYWNFTSAFGGWALAVGLAAVRATDTSGGALISINAIFPDALKAKDLIVVATCLRQKAKTSFWRVTFYEAGQEDAPLLFSADMILSVRRKTDAAFQTPAPDAPPVETCEEFDAAMGPKWMAHYQQRNIKGQPFTCQETPNSLIWMAERDGRPWDEKGIVAVSDTFMPRIFFADTTPRFGSTVSFGLHLFANGADFEAAGNVPLLLEGDSDMIGDGLYDQRGKMWSSAGCLLAITNQVAFYR
jgi:acyl-CoA thioesterase